MSDCIATARGEANATAWNSSTWTRRPPVWLPESEKLQARRNWRCYWGPAADWSPPVTSASAKAAAHTLKLSALLRDLYFLLAPKAYYAKIETDSLLLPLNLMRLLVSLAGSLAPSRAIYLGVDVFHMHKPGSRAAATLSSQRQQLGPECRQQHAASHPHSDCVMGSSGWRSLVGGAGWSAEHARSVDATTYLTYAQGGFEGLSRAALRAIVDDGPEDCLQAVSTLPCAGAVNGTWPEDNRANHNNFCGVHQHEDVALGMCALLKQIRLVDCPAIMGSPPACPAPENTSLWSHWNYCGDGSGQAQLPRYPVNMHGVKDVRQYHRWWGALMQRDELPEFGPAFQEWRQDDSTAVRSRIAAWG